MTDKIDIRLTETERELFKSAGGSRWLRQALWIAKIKCDTRSGVKARTTEDKSKATVHMQVRVTPGQAQKFHALGASSWIRETLKDMVIESFG